MGCTRKRNKCKWKTLGKNKIEKINWRCSVTVTRDIWDVQFEVRIFHLRPKKLMEKYEMTISLQKFNHSNPVAMELFSSGWCNLDCAYCYIPKDDKFLMKFHRKIIENIKNGIYIKKLKELYGNNLTSISHWGTEPTLTLQLFNDFYIKALEEFPKLENFKLSSNFMTNPKILSNFIKKFSIEDNRKFTFDIQISLDGPEWITDKNRIKGSTKKIVNNVIKFVDLINSEKLSDNKIIKIHFKCTSTRDDHKKLANDYDLLIDYYQFFDNILKQIYDKNEKYRNIKNMPISCDPTIVVPQKFTKEDGQIISKLYDNQIKLKSENKYKYVKPDSTYYHRFKNRSLQLNELFIKHKMFTCSAGDSCFSTDESLNIIPCHRAYYLNDDNYNDIVKKHLKNKKYETGIINSKNEKCNNLEQVKKYYISNDDKTLLNQMLLNRSYHDFFKSRHTTEVSIIKMMAECDQVSKVYTNYSNASYLSIFTSICMNCCMENIFNNGSINVSDSYLLKLFGNGLAEKILKRIYYKKDETCQSK